MIEELHDNLDEKFKRSVDFGHTFSPVIEMRSLKMIGKKLKHEKQYVWMFCYHLVSHNRNYLKIEELKKFLN